MANEAFENAQNSSGAEACLQIPDVLAIAALFVLFSQYFHISKIGRLC